MRAARFLAGFLPRLFPLGLAIAGFSAVLPVSRAVAQEAEYNAQKWSFDGVFGVPDRASAQRGFQVYAEVCSVCHAMKQLHYRDLEGIGLNEEQIKAVAAGFTVPQGLNDAGEPKEGPATPSNQFRSPFPNDIAARAANNGSLPPDLSLIANAREGHADYLFGVLTGYADPPGGFKMQDGMNYNRSFPGHQIAMAPPLSAGRVTYIDGTPTTLDQQARDVVTFMEWAANPEAAERKAMGVRIVLFLILLTIVSYAVKRKIWSKVH